MLGEIVPYRDENIVGQVCGLQGVLSLLKDIKKVFIPPIPRFVFGGCCANKTHASNTSAPEHSGKMLTEHTQQRHTITKILVDMKTTTFRVTDILCIFVTSHESLTDKARKLSTFTHKDNMHLTPTGYKLLAEELLLDCNSLAAKQHSAVKQTKAATSTPPSEEKFWRGFSTTQGVGRTSTTATFRRGGVRHHPNRR